MKTSQHTAEQIIKILEQAEKGEQTIAGVCREHGIAENTFYRWRKAYGGMSVNELQRLKRLLAERMLEIDLLKELLGKRADAGRPARSRAVLRDRWAVGAARLRSGADPSLDLPLRCASS